MSHRFHTMMRKLFWFMTFMTVVLTATSLVDRSRAARRRELWSEATD